MFKKIVFLTTTSVLFAGCASVPTEQVEVSNVLKQVKAPSANNAGLYIYRSNIVEEF